MRCNVIQIASMLMATTSIVSSFVIQQQKPLIPVISSNNAKHRTVSFTSATATSTSIHSSSFQHTEDDETNVTNNGDYGNIVPNTVSLLTNELSILILLSFLSGLSPALQISGESHVSRLPDSPIAHDIDTMLLWPAIFNDKIGHVPFTFFQAPFAAVTSESMYGVDWSNVIITYCSNVGTSLLISFMMAFSLVLFLKDGSGDNDWSESETITTVDSTDFLL